VGTTLAVTSSSAPVAAGKLGADFRPFDFSSTGTVNAELVFAGYGITAPEYAYDDYRGLDVRGKVVLILRYEPNENDPTSVFAGARHTSHAYFATKARNARAHGAIGMLLFTTPLAHGPEEDLRAAAAYRLHPGELEKAGTEEGATFIALQVSQGFADMLARAAGATIRELQAAVDRGTSPAELGVRGLSITAAVARAGSPEPVRARDVVGYLRGARADRLVLVGAHHDHIGAFAPAGAGDTIYNGADDNASGVAGVLELARAFGRRRAKPAQSLVFATFSGEEEYLLGSAALIESGLIAPSTISFMLNLDMIGRNPGGELQVFGTSGAADLRTVVEKANEPLELRLAFPTQLGDSLDSDQSVFRKAGVPSLFFHTGLHDDYHGLDDEADRLDYEHMRRVVELAYRVLEERAAAPALR